MQTLQAGYGRLEKERVGQGETLSRPRGKRKRKCRTKQPDRKFRHAENTAESTLSASPPKSFTLWDMGVLHQNSLSDIDRENLITAIENSPYTLNLKQACETLSIPYSTVYTWKKVYTDWAQRLDDALVKAKDRAADAIEDNLLSFAMSPDPVAVSAAKFMLSAHKPKTYAKQAAPALTVNNYSLVLVPRGAPEANQAVRAIDVTPEPAQIEAGESDEPVW